MIACSASSRSGGRYESSGFRATVADEESPKELLQTVRDFIAECIQRENGLVCSVEPGKRGTGMAKPNYAFAKRQRDLAKKNKKEEKRLRKSGTEGAPSPESEPRPASDEKTAS